MASNSILLIPFILSNSFRRSYTLSEPHNHTRWSRARQEAVLDYRIPKAAAPTRSPVFDHAHGPPRHDPASWPEARVNQELAPRQLDTSQSRPAVDPSPPSRKTEAELRQSPEWKRASRQERKRLLQAARASPNR